MLLLLILGIAACTATAILFGKFGGFEYCSSLVTNRIALRHQNAEVDLAKRQKTGFPTPLRTQVVTESARLSVG